jgi:hypothetical protein
MLLLFCLAPNAFSQVLPDAGVQIYPGASQVSPKTDAPLIPVVEKSRTEESKYKRRVIDILAIPHEKETYVGASYDYSSSSTQRSGSDDYKVKSHEVNIGLERGLTDHLSAQVQWGYLLSDTAYSGSSNLGNSTGISDPYLGLNYRAMDISRNRFDLNINPYFSPTLQDATSSSERKDGNGSRGYQYTGIKAGIGRRDGPSSWAFSMDFFKAFNGEYQDAESGDKTKTSSFQAITIYYDYMKYFSEVFSLRGQIGLGAVEGVEYKFSDGSTSTSNSRRIIYGSIKTFYETRPNIFLTSELGLSGSSDAGSSDSYTAEGKEISTNTGRFTFSLGVLAQF